MDARHHHVDIAGRWSLVADRFSPCRTRADAPDTASGLWFMHRHRLVHRDLKPANVLLRYPATTAPPWPFLKIADFGFAKHDATGTLNGRFGSLLYMAPEILLRDTYDARVDLWSTGVIFYGAPNTPAPRTHGGQAGQDSWEVWALTAAARGVDPRARADQRCSLGAHRSRRLRATAS